MADLPFPADATHLNVKEVSALFRVCPKTVRRWIAAGTLTASRVGRDWRVARSDLRELARTTGNRWLADVL